MGQHGQGGQCQADRAFQVSISWSLFQQPRHGILPGPCAAGVGRGHRGRFPASGLLQFDQTGSAFGMHIILITGTLRKMV